MNMKAKIQAAEMRVNETAATTSFDSFEKWSKAAAAAGLRVKKVTVSNLNTYYQAIHPTKGLVGFFNSREGKKGKDPATRPGGNLNVKATAATEDHSDPSESSDASSLARELAKSLRLRGRLVPSGSGEAWFLITDPETVPSLATLKSVFKAAGGSDIKQRGTPVSHQQGGAWVTNPQYETGFSVACYVDESDCTVVFSADTTSLLVLSGR